MEATRLSEEARGYLRRIVEGLVYRQLMLANIRGHALKYVLDLEEKIELAAELGRALEELRPARTLYRAIRTGNVISVIRSKMEKIPYPASQVELACCLRLCELVNDVVDECYTGSICDELAEIAQRRLAAGPRVHPLEDDVFVEYCAEVVHLPRAREYFSNWLALTLMAIGRPGTRADQRTVELGLRDRSTAEIATLFLERLAPFMDRCGLVLPEAAVLGVELPPEIASRPR